MAFLRVIILISICFAVVIQALHKEQFNRQPITIQCGTNEHIEIVKTEIKQKGNLESIQRRIFNTLPKEMTHAVKKKCHYKNICVVNEDIHINNKISLDIEYNCINTRCPNQKFIQKHIVRLVNNPTEDQIKQQIIHSLAGDRGRQNWLPTDIVDFYIDPEEFMNYEKRGNECVFKTAAQKFHCEKNSNHYWNCERRGTAKAYHDTVSGHYIARKTVQVTT